jgi:hypothetical protein
MQAVHIAGTLYLATKLYDVIIRKIKWVNNKLKTVSIKVFIAWSEVPSWYLPGETQSLAKVAILLLEVKSNGDYSWETSVKINKVQYGHFLNKSCEKFLYIFKMSPFVTIHVRFVGCARTLEFNLLWKNRYKIYLRVCLCNTKFFCINTC